MNDNPPRQREWRLIGNPAVVVGVIFALAFPWLPFVSFSVVGTANLAAYYAMVAVSLVVLTGWVGQISLGHAGLVGVGAYVTGHVMEGLHITFPVNLLWAGAAGAIVAIVLGAVAVRVRGLYLAVATIIFSWTASEFLFRQRSFTSHANVTVPSFGEPGTFPFFDWTARRTYYYAAWAAVAGAIYLVANLRDSKTGRAFFAVRGSEVAAASLGINVARTKLLAFAVSGALAGMAGNLLIIRDQVVTSDSFRVEVSLFFLAIAVVGGLASLGGAVAASILFAALNEVFFRVEAFSGWLEVVPPVLLTAVLLLYRGGLAAIPPAIWRRWGGRVEPLLAGVRSEIHRSRDNLRARFPRLRARADTASGKGVGQLAPLQERVARLVPEQIRARLAKFVPTGTVPAQPRLDFAALVADQEAASNGHKETAAEPEPSVDHPEGAVAAAVPAIGWRHLEVTRPALPPEREDRVPLIDVRGVTVQFGGLTAVDDVTLSVRENEIVGLIGPNGAGKTTTFNSIAGLNVPTRGEVLIYGHEVSQWPVDRRAKLGVARTFQAIQLLPQLSVFDNLLVATHVHNPSGFVSHLFIGRSTLEAEAEGRRQVRLVADLLELRPYLDRRVADLPFGVLRMVEVARAMVTGARLMMLDEPASGLDNTETERLSEILRFIRDLGVTLLLIEHDVALVTSISDYIYVLDHGAMLAEGTAAEVHRDERVIAAYLGEETEDDEQQAVPVA